MNLDKILSDITPINKPLKDRLIKPIISVKEIYNMDKNGKFKKGGNLSDEHKEKLRQAKLKNPTKYWLGKKRPEMINNKRGFIKGNTSWNKGKKFPQISGKKHWNWKGGITPRMLNTPEYKLWRKKVFERDNYTCQFCGQRGGDLEADHIKPWALYPKLRFEVSNGRTLCKKCHKTTFRFYGNKYTKNNHGQS